LGYPKTDPMKLSTDESREKMLKANFISLNPEGQNFRPTCAGSLNASVSIVLGGGGAGLWGKRHSHVTNLVCLCRGSLVWHHRIFPRVSAGFVVWVVCPAHGFKLFRSIGSVLGKFGFRIRRLWVFYRAICGFLGQSSGSGSPVRCLLSALVLLQKLGWPGPPPVVAPTPRGTTEKDTTVVIVLLALSGSSSC